jgi:type II secretory pathway pseudopilin PulG
MRQNRSSSAFTLVETMLIMAIIGLLFGISSVLLSRLVPRANLVSSTETLTAELRSQQLRAMTGEKNAANQADQHGIYLEGNQYTLFSGSSFNPSATDNLVTALNSSVQLSTNFPDQSVVFARGGGEILNFNPSANTITLTDTLSGETRTIIFNSYGIPN